jgi:hypothetical protein
MPVLFPDRKPACIINWEIPFYNRLNLVTSASIIGRRTSVFSISLVSIFLLQWLENYWFVLQCKSTLVGPYTTSWCIWLELVGPIVCCPPGPGPQTPLFCWTPVFKDEFCCLFGTLMWIILLRSLGCINSSRRFHSHSSSSLNTGVQQNNGVCGPGPGGQQTIGPTNSSQMHHDVVYGPTRVDLHCNTNQ